MKRILPVLSFLSLALAGGLKAQQIGDNDLMPTMQV
jgi:hypothetical protein